MVYYNEMAHSQKSFNQIWIATLSWKFFYLYNDDSKIVFVFVTANYYTRGFLPN